MPGKYESNLVSAIAELSAWAGTKPPDGIYGVNKTVKQAYIPLHMDETKAYRIDIENLRGHNLRF